MILTKKNMLLITIILFNAILKFKGKNIERVRIFLMKYTYFLLYSPI